MAESNPTAWPSFWLAMFRPRRYEQLMAQANEASRRWSDEQRDRIYKRHAQEQVARLRRELSPERRLQLQQALAQWEAHLDSLDDDGVPAVPKGHE